MGPHFPVIIWSLGQSIIKIWCFSWLTSRYIDLGHTGTIFLQTTTDLDSWEKNYQWHHYIDYRHMVVYLISAKNVLFIAEITRGPMFWNVKKCRGATTKCNDFVQNTVETLYSTIYYSKYFIELNFDKSTQYVALWTHKRHPIPRPFGRAMECLFWVLQQKLTVL